jgi:glyceraldehyde 3-phosphate dehydrogenase
MVLPQLKGRLDGMAMRVPVLDGSIVDLVCKLRKKASGAEINAAVREAAEGPMKHMLDYSVDPLVSTDIVGNPYSSIFDSLSTNVNGNDGYAKVVSWYDNEWGYSNRVVDLLGRLAAFDA